MQLSWTTQYNIACDEVKVAKKQRELAESALYIAEQRCKQADREMSRLCRERETGYAP